MKSFRDLSVKTKLMTMVVGTSFVILAAGLVMVTIHSAIQGRRRLAASAIKNAELASEYAVVPLAFDDTAQAAKNLLSLRTLPSVEKAVIYGEDDRPFTAYRASGDTEVPPVERRDYYSEFRHGYCHVFRPISRDATTYGTLYLAVSTAELDRELRDTLLVFTAALLVLIVAASVLASVFQRSLTDPVRKLVQVMGTVRGSPDSSTRITWRGDDEIGALYDGFNSMLARIEQAQRQLRKSEAKHRTIIASMSDVIFVCDTDSRFVEVYGDPGPAMRRPAEEFVGKTVRELMPAAVAEELETLGRMVRETGESRQMEQALDLGGEKKWYSVNIDLHENRENLVLTVRDISERKVLLERLNQSEKMEAVGLLAGGVAHDFNNMLVGIMSAAELLKVAGDTPESREEYLEMITGSASRAADLTGKLLAFARKGKLETAPLDLNQAIADAMALLERSVDKRITITATLQAGDKVVRGDPTQLQNIFLNLGINAAHAMPGGGVIDFATRNVTLTEEQCRRSLFEIRPGPYVAVEVRDTGCGIPPEHMDRIFEPFFTTKEKGRGTGLGLAAVYGTVTEHKGDIAVSSEVGRGTVFTIHLPVHAALRAEEETREELAYGQGRVLVVDDEPVNRKVAVALLSKLGYDATAAANGPEAVEIFKHEHDGIDLVLLDIQMPAMSGQECFRILKQLDPSVRAVICSGFLRDVDIDELLSEGLRGYIQKPYEGVEFSRVIARAMRE
jgi:PAS domain S-box-containing protein